MCIKSFNKQFLKVIRSNGELKPFIIYFRTPEIEHMRNVWKPQSHITVSTLIKEIILQHCFAGTRNEDIGSTGH